MRATREALAQAVLGTLGAVFGVLSGIALALAAFVPALLGLLAFVLSPLRALADRVRESRER